MKKTIALVLVLALCLAATPALAAGKLNVVQEDFRVVSGWSNYGYAYAKVENSGDKPIQINNGVLEIYDAEGEVLASTDYFSSTGPRYLQPGESSYVSMYKEIAEGATADDYMLTLTGKSDNSKVCKRLPVTAELALDVKDGWWTYNYIYVSVTNDTEEPLYSVDVVMSLLDEAGAILYMNSNSLYNVAIAPGSTVIFRQDISSSFIEYFAANSITPASVDAIAWVDVDQN